MEYVSSGDTQDEGEEIMLDFWDDKEWEKVLRHRKIAYREGVRDGIACGAVLVTVFAYVWCYFWR